MSAKLKKWQSQAPANTMILGEHSVVYGHPAIACAVDQYVTIEWQQRSDKGLHIVSALGEHHTQINQISKHPKLNFVIAVLQAFQSRLNFGLDITIHSEFSSTIGLGSSAAVLAAMISGLNHICQAQLTLIEQFSLGHKIIIDIQGRGSGTDLAASLAGGMIFFQPVNENQAKPIIKKLPINLPLVLIYSGYKTPTAEVLKQVAIDWQDKPNKLKMLYRSMAKITRGALYALEHHQFENFYQACKDYQKQMENLGVSDSVLDEIIMALNGCADIHCAKISGSGLGDCVLGIGELNLCSNQAQKILSHYQSIQIQISQQGAYSEAL
ncbi:mevalonate kinase [Thiomicrorhabdus sediminis]|uniref:Mevalonate kinase n=1 Tax=Thiomicrorhabdus sediminis TaxID=2580412 RepID=A0A4P9K706_9GAMM|nr:mevalonate kinase [Thiomicrorhabdus sediminis]QCU90671.1 mevalonate kinase [Thiomicrorhabdus sediminis]